MKDTNEAYRLAAQLTVPLQEMMGSEEHKLTPENARLWLLFCRTVKTSVDLVEELAREALKIK